MELLLSQKNKLYRLIEAQKLNLHDFKLVDVVDSNKVTVGWGVNYLPHDKFCFQFTKTDFVLEISYEIVLSPGSQSVVENFSLGKTFSAELVFTKFTHWLSFVQRETSQEDLWKKFEESANAITQQIDGKEIPNDINFIQSTVEGILQGLPALGLPPQVQQRITINLNQTINLYQNNKDFDWFGYIIGTITSVVITMSLSPETGKALWNLVGSVFRKLLGS